MKNKSVVIILCLSIFAVLGCGIGDQVQKAVEGDSNSNKSVSDQVTEDILREKTGVPECDEVINFFADQSKNNDESFVSKATKEFVFNKIRQSLKENIEKNQNDKVKMAQSCKEYKAQIDKYLAEQNSNKK